MRGLGTWGYLDLAEDELYYASPRAVCRSVGLCRSEVVESVHEGDKSLNDNRADAFRFVLIAFGN